MDFLLRSRLSPPHPPALTLPTASGLHTQVFTLPRHSIWPGLWELDLAQHSDHSPTSPFDPTPESTAPHGNSYRLQVWSSKQTKITFTLNPCRPTRSVQSTYDHSSIQSHSRIRLSATPWAAARQASLSITIPGACSNLCPSSR